MRKVLCDRYCSIAVLSVLVLTFGMTQCFADPVFIDTSGLALGWTVAVKDAGFDGGEGSPVSIGDFAPPSTTAATPRANLANWIAANSTGSSGSFTGDYQLFTFQQKFDLTGYDPATAVLTFQWAADDSGESFATRGQWTPKFSLNGGGLQEYPGSPTNTYSLSSPVTLTSGFISGINAITFYVEGNGTTDGLSVIKSSFTASTSTHNPVPEPTSLLLFGTGLGAIGLATWRRRK